MGRGKAKDAYDIYFLLKHYPAVQSSWLLNFPDYHKYRLFAKWEKNCWENSPRLIMLVRLMLPTSWIYLMNRKLKCSAGTPLNKSRHSCRQYDFLLGVLNNRNPNRSDWYIGTRRSSHSTITNFPPIRFFTSPRTANAFSKIWFPGNSACEKESFLPIWPIRKQGILWSGHLLDYWIFSIS